MRDNDLKKLLEKMTLKEKISQLIQLTPHFFKGSGKITGPLASLNIDEGVVSNSGSVLGASGASEIVNIQKKFLEENRLGIPLLFMADIIHGYKTIFPVPLAIGCSWDLKLAEKSAEIAAKEASAAGIHVTFSPMVDLVRDPRWGRVMESTGEDPYLNSEFAKAFTRGYQGSDLSEDVSRLAACVKHFAGYGAVEGGRDYNTVDMSELQLREYYLPSYKAAIDEGAEMVMTSFNTVAGVPSTGNEWLMKDVLRDEWGFEGVVISDWGAVKELIPHGVAKDEKEAAYKAILVGVDIEMMTSTYVQHLEELVKENKIKESIINDAVLRILRLKNKLGLFERPYRGANEVLEKQVLLCQQHRNEARNLATKSTVLLKNTGVLPLKITQKVALIGPFAENRDILGPWSWLGSKDDVVTLGEGLKTKAHDSFLFIAKGCDIEDSTEEEWIQAKQAIKQADVIVLALGEKSDMSGEAGSRGNIKLPDAQLQLIKKVKQYKKPIVVILFNGRPLDLHGVIENADAILEAWFPGTEGGNALADLLYGDENPSGKLTMSFPYSAGQIPVYYNCFNTGRPKDVQDAQERYVSQYLDIPNEPLFPFGYGLSYTTFQYTDAKLSKVNFTTNETLAVSVRVTNTGAMSGEEIVQLYIRDIIGDVARPLKELKGFKKVFLNPGESKIVTFEITEKHLKYHHQNLNFKSDSGDFIAFIGPNSKDLIALPFRFEK